MNTIDKNGFLYKNMAKYRLKLTAIVVIFAMIFGWFSVSCAKYLTKRAFGSSPIDVNAFSAECKTMVLDANYTYDKNSPEAKIFGYAIESRTYMQGNKYYFNVPVGDVIDTDVAFTISGAVLTPEVDTESDKVAVIVKYATVGDVCVPLLMLPDQKLASGDAVDGVFVEASPLILEQLAKQDAAIPRRISTYMLDLRGIEMGSEFSDTLLWLIMLAILLYLVVKLAIYYIKPVRHPMFAQLDKYGDIYAIAEDIEHQLKSDATQFYKKEIYTEEWLLTKQSFKYRIGKNHTSGGKFRYTPGDK